MRKSKSIFYLALFLAALMCVSPSCAQELKPETKTDTGKEVSETASVPEPEPEPTPDAPVVSEADKESTLEDAPAVSEDDKKSAPETETSASEIDAEKPQEQSPPEESGTGETLQAPEVAKEDKDPEPDVEEKEAELPPEETQAETEADPMKNSVWNLNPEYIRLLTPVQSGHNDSNPMWSPSGNMLTFERSIGDKRKIIIALRDGTIIKKIYFQTPEENNGMDFFFPGITDTASYNAGMSWSGNDKSLVFMSNGGSGNYDLYLLPSLNHKEPLRLTQNTGKDSHPHWSPVSDLLVFVSGRTGKADIFTMDLTTRQTRQIAYGDKMYLYPQWSPDGKKIAMIYGSNENHDIVIVEDLAQPQKSTKTITKWTYDDLRPVWSPDGKKIAFYSNYNLSGDQKKWCIIVVDAVGPEILSEDTLTASIVAHEVIPDIDLGPAWMPDSQHIVYVKNDKQAFNPIFMVNIDQKIPIAVNTDTKMNHDVACSPDGTLAFRAQIEQWDHIYITKIDPEAVVVKEIQ